MGRGTASRLADLSGYHLAFLSNSLLAVEEWDSLAEGLLSFLIANNLVEPEGSLNGCVFAFHIPSGESVAVLGRLRAGSAAGDVDGNCLDLFLLFDIIGWDSDVDTFLLADGLASLGGEVVWLLLPNPFSGGDVDSDRLALLLVGSRSWHNLRDHPGDTSGDLSANALLTGGTALLVDRVTHTTSHATNRLPDLLARRAADHGVDTWNSTANVSPGTLRYRDHARARWLTSGLRLRNTTQSRSLLQGANSVGLEVVPGTDAGSLSTVASSAGRGGTLGNRHVITGLLKDGLPHCDVANNALSRDGDHPASGTGDGVDSWLGDLNGTGALLHDVCAVVGGHILAPGDDLLVGGGELVVDPLKLCRYNPGGGIANLPLVLEALCHRLGRADGGLELPGLSGGHSPTDGSLLGDAGLFNAILALRDLGGVALALVDGVATLTPDAAVLVGHSATLVGHLAGAGRAHGLGLAGHGTGEAPVGVSGVVLGLSLGLCHGLGLGEGFGLGVGVRIGLGVQSNRQGADEENEEGLFMARL